ncbi:hypothetical protein DV736_g414, partial [Chaetothyriales sp. CBS 134916]
MRINITSDETAQLLIPLNLGNTAVGMATGCGPMNGVWFSLVGNAAGGLGSIGHVGSTGELQFFQLRNPPTRRLCTQSPDALIRVTFDEAVTPITDEEYISMLTQNAMVRGVYTMGSIGVQPFQTTFAVPLHCESCVKDVSGALYKLDGICKVEANLDEQLILIEGTAAPSAIVLAIQSTGRDAILRGSGKTNSAGVCILETHSTSVPDHVRGLARMVQLADKLTLVDLSLQGVSPGTYHATVRESGDISQGAASTGGIWDAITSLGSFAKPTPDPVPRGVFGTVEVGQDGRGSSFLGRPVSIWEIIGRSMVVTKQVEGPLRQEDPDTLVGVIARSAGVWDNQKTSPFRLNTGHGGAFPSAMSLKQEIETWVQALSHYDNTEYEESLKVFDGIADTSKILFNCGVIHATIGEHERAIECYQRAIRLDQYLAVAYFQQGVSSFLMGDFEDALAMFNDTLLYLRGNTYIDYEQLGLKFKLYSCEVLFNRGLCYIYLQQDAAGMQDFAYAQKEKMTPDHDGYTVFSIPVGVVYRPNDAKVKNLKTKDYLGKARLIATANQQNTSTGFAGAERKQALAQELAPKDDRPAENISYAATNLIIRNLSTRGTREQSAPAVVGARNIFPPTPPPEAEKPSTRSSSSSDKQLPVRSMSGRQPLRTMPPPPLRAKNDPQGASPQPQPGMLSRAQTFDANGTQPSSLSSRPLPSSPETSWSNELGPSLVDPVSTINRPPPRRIGTVRGQSEPRGPLPSRQQYAPQPFNGAQQPSSFSRSNTFTSSRSTAPGPGPLFRETTAQSRFNTFDQDSAEDTVDDVYGMYAASGPPPQQQLNTRSQSRRGAPQSRSRDPPPPPQNGYGNGTSVNSPLEEVDEDDFQDYSEVTPEEMAAFEPVNSSTLIRSPPTRSRTPAHDSFGNGATGGSSAGGRRPEMRKIRIKVHDADDTRYILMPLSPSVSRSIGTLGLDFGDFEARIREKFSVKGVLKIRIKEDDSGDMITMGDQDDLEVCMHGVRLVARRERSEMGKMEVWINY